VVLAIAVQVLVPLVALFSPDLPNRGGFQMYSALGTVRMTVLDDDGHRLRVDPDLFAGIVRPELSWLDALPDYLCKHVPDAATVEVSQNGDTRRATC
jgi:hypothetical protein